MDTRIFTEERSRCGGIRDLTYDVRACGFSFTSRVVTPNHFILTAFFMFCVTLTLVSTATSLGSATGCFNDAVRYTPCPDG